MPIDTLAPGRLIVGKNPRDNQVFVGRFVQSGAGVDGNVFVESYDAVGAGNVIFARARGTFDAPAIVQAGDILGELEFSAYTNAWHHCAEIQSTVCGAPAAGVIPDSDLQLKTTSGGGVDTIRVRVMPAGRVVVGAAATMTEAQITAEGTGQVWVGLSTSGTAITAQAAGAVAAGASIISRKSRGTLAAPGSVNQYDGLINFRGECYTNAWHTDLGGIGLYVGTAVTAGQAPGTVLEFRANANNTASVVVASVKVGSAAEGSLCVGSGTDTSHVLVVGASRAGGSVVRMDNNAGGGTADVLYLRGGDNATTGSRFLTFGRPDNSVIGSVSQNAAATVAYNTSSDERIKADIADAEKGLAELMQIRVRKFRYKSDPSNQMVQGFIAQELNAVFPDAVSPGGTAKDCNCAFASKLVDGKMQKDGHDSDCVQRNPWGVDYGRLSPLLVRAVQELAGRVSALEGK